MAEGCGNSVGSMGNEVRKTQRLLSRGPGFNAFGSIINAKEAMEDFKLDQHNLIILIILQKMDQRYDFLKKDREITLTKKKKRLFGRNQATKDDGQSQDGARKNWHLHDNMLERRIDVSG